MATKKMKEHMILSQMALSRAQSRLAGDWQ
jgi:hypothetical protein